MKIEIPQSWEHITIKQFSELYALKSLEQDHIDYMIDVVMITCKLKYHEVSSLSLVQLKDIFGKLSFIESEPIKDKIVDRYESQGIMYVAQRDISKISAGQYIDLKTFIEKEPIKNIHNIMAVLYVPYKKKYNEVPVTEIADSFYDTMPITVAYPFALFFCNLLNNSMPAISLCLEKEVKETMTRTLKAVKQG